MTYSGEAFSPFLHVIGMKLDLCCFPDDAFHVSGSHGHDPGVLKLDTVTQVSAVLKPQLICQDDSLMCLWCSLILVSVEHQV